MSLSGFCDVYTNEGRTVYRFGMGETCDEKWYITASRWELVDKVDGLRSSVCGQVPGCGHWEQTKRFIYVGICHNGAEVDCSTEQMARTVFTSLMWTTSIQDPERMLMVQIA